MNKNNIISCPSCAFKKIVRTGKRKNKNQIIQRYLCKKCRKTFSLNPIKNKTYPIKIILNTISFYNLGHTQKEVIKLISRKHKTKVPQKTISNWIAQYKNIATFNKLRQQAKTLYPPEQIIFKQTLNHIQPYTFQYHKSKLELLFKSRLYNNQFTNTRKNQRFFVSQKPTISVRSKFYEPIKSYLNKITTNKFPHHIFKEKIKTINSINKKITKNNATSASGQNTNKNLLEQRASQIRFPHLKITHLSKTNLANKLADLALNLAKTNKQRHQAIQNFMLINDSTTVATEIPVYLTKDDIIYFLNRNFKLPLENQKTPITGHIDIIQIRNGLIHILDYKPDAKHQNPIHQLTIYALALASKTKLALSDFKCAWFDENNYFEFYPLHAVYKKR